MHIETDNLDGVSIHTGFPNPGADAQLRGLNLNQVLVQNSASTFLMRVAGQDWQYLGIFRDDLVIIDRALSPRSQDIIIWHHEGDFFISERRRMRQDGVFWGVVTATIHQFRQIGVAR